MNKPFFKKLFHTLKREELVYRSVPRDHQSLWMLQNHCIIKEKKMKRNLRRAFARPLIARARTHTHTHPHTHTPTHTHTQCARLFPFGITNNLIVRIDFIAVSFFKKQN